MHQTQLSSPGNNDVSAFPLPTKKLHTVQTDKANPVFPSF